MHLLSFRSTVLLSFRLGSAKSSLKIALVVISELIDQQVSKELMSLNLRRNLLNRLVKNSGSITV